MRFCCGARHLLSMDTISRENNSMLPVGAIIVGVIALLLGGFAAIKVSSLQNGVKENQPKIDKIDGIESAATSAATASEKTSRELTTRMRETQDAFNQVGNVLTDRRASVTRLEESAKNPAVAASGKKGGEAPVAGPGEYVVKAGDNSGTKIAKDHGVSLEDLKAVNPGVD